MGAIAHECYHAFQHKACRDGWKGWYWDDLGVTEGRVSMWYYNFYGEKSSEKAKSKYFDISEDEEAYMVQIVESDARAFEVDCEKARQENMALLELE